MKPGLDILNRFDLNLLLVFEAVYSEGGVSRAAARLCLTQSAVSHALRRLREVLNDPLFSRQGHLMIPNRTAERLIEPVRLALRTVKQSLDGLNSFEPASSDKHFRIGVRAAAESFVVPAIFAALKQAAPNATLGVIPHDRTSLGPLLKSRTIDVALDVAHRHYDAIASELMGKVGFVAMFRRDHPSAGEKFTIERYLQLDHIVASPRPSGLGFEDAILRGLIRGRKVTLHCHDYMTAARVAAASDAVLTVPEHFSNAIAEQIDLAIADPFPNLEFDSAMYWNSEVANEPGIAWLLDLLRSCAFQTGLGPIQRRR